MKGLLFLATLLVSLLVSTEADAQIFRFRQKTTTFSSCPGGVCPTNVQSAGHWTFGPESTIEQHLSRTHGQSTAGLTREQMLSLHDSLHEGRRINMVPSPTKEVVQTYRVPSPAQKVVAVVRSRTRINPMFTGKYLGPF